VRTTVIRAGWVLLALLAIAFVVLAAWEPFFAEQPGPAPQGHYRAEITRDEWGVPHIRGATDADVGFGIAWAHSEDDFSTLQDVVAMTRGRYGAIAGPDGAKVDYIYHLLDARGTAHREYPKLPADTRALLEAYAAGLNRYAAAHPMEVKLSRLFPVNGEDVAAGFALRQPFFYGLDKVIEPLATGGTLAPEQGPPIPQQPAASPLGANSEQDGSNAFAVAPSRTGDGTTLLVSNTHQPWRGPVAWYELVVESGQGWHLAGATFPGAPFPLLGHNETLGWTNTLNRPDLADVYKLTLDQAGTHYRMDGKWKPLGHERVLLPVRFGPIVLPVWRDVWRSEHGPVLKSAKGAFAIRYGGMGSIAQIAGYFHLNKAKTYAEWRAVLATKAVPSTNFVYADAAGNIAYIYDAAFPARPKGFNWRGVLSGDTSADIWHAMAPFSAWPQYLNPASGYLYNSNNTPFHAAGPSDLSPAAYPPEMGVELTMTNRARRAGKLFAAAGMVPLPVLKRIKYDTGWERDGYVKTMLDGVARIDTSHDRLLAKAQKLLAGWDLESDGKGPADALAAMVLERATSADYNNRPLPDPKERLSWAAQHLMKYFGRLDPPLGEVQRLRQGKTDLPYDGGPDTLRAATNWDIAPDGRLSVKHGDSFILFVEWPKGGPVQSQSILPFGSATTRPGNPHYSDQSALFVKHEVKPVHFTAADIAAHAVRRTIVTSAS
jgi:acyl-homoserine-lactone acylase